MTIRKHSYLDLYLLAAIAFCPGMARAGFVLTLEPSANLTAPAGATVSWVLRTDNLDPSRYLSIDSVNTTIVLDSAQGTADNFAAFPFPLVAPCQSMTVPCFRSSGRLARRPAILSKAAS